MSTFDVTGIGETLVRLSVYPGTRLENARQLVVHTGGAESNTLVALSQLGHSCGWVGGLANNDLGRSAAADLRRYGVDISGAFQCSSARMGTYFVEHAVDPLVTRVEYDRERSCASTLSPDLVDWELVLDTQILHLTGITPALSLSALTTVEEAVPRAKAAGVKVSFDINFRTKLWSADEAASVLGALIESVDVLTCSHRDAILVFGCSDDPSDAVRDLADKTSAEYVILTRGDQGGMLFDGSSIHQQPALSATSIDRFGAGDAFVAGILHGVLKGDILLGMKYATVLASLTLGQYGDMVTTNLEEVAALANPTSGANEVER